MKQSKPITIFTTPTCPYCHALMDWCDQVGIAYIEKNLEDPQTNLEAVRDYGEIEIVPTSIVNGDVIVGFNRRAIKKALRLDTGEADEEDES